MIHKMHLHDSPFVAIKSGSKTIELRLNDEKRRLIKTGDHILFSMSSDEHETVLVEVIGIQIFQNFNELYQTVPLDQCGYQEKNIHLASAKDMLPYYSIEKQTQFGVLAIEIKLLGQREDLVSFKDIK